MKKAIEIMNKIKWVFAALILVNISCNTNKNENKNYSFPVRYYKLGFSIKEKNTDTMHVKYEKKNDSLIFKYKCDKLKEGEDLFEINNDTSVYYQRTKIVKVDVKNLKIGDSSIVIEKYINLNTISPHGLSDIYFNRKYGLVLIKNLTTNVIVEYNTDRFKEIHKRIISDTLLFKNSMEIIKLE